MVRLGGPFTGAGNRQDPNYRPEVLQPFVVDPADPVVRLAYNVYSWDFPPYDSVELRITLTSEAGAKIADIGRQAPTGPGELNSTGWQPATFDLGAFKGQTVFLRVSAGGTVDTSLPTWAYVDGLPTTVTGPPPANPVVTSAKRPPCQGLKGKRRAKCQIEQQVKKKCDSKRGKRKKACAARVRAVAKCKALPTKSKRQRAKRSRCLALVKSGAGTKKGKQGKRKR